MQIAENGVKTAWAQQYDALTLEPTSARNYEMASQSAAESANILLFLMELPQPTAAEGQAIDAAAMADQSCDSRLRVSSDASGP